MKRHEIIKVGRERGNTLRHGFCNLLFLCQTLRNEKGLQEGAANQRNHSVVIRSSKVYFRKELNSGKANRLESFLTEYRRVAQVYMDWAWTQAEKNQYRVPDFIDKKSSPQVDSSLSARALKCCSTQVLGIVKSVTKKKQKALYVKALRESKRQKIYPSLLEEANRELTKPSLKSLKPELNSICVDFQETGGEFNGFLCLKSLGKSFGKISIPVKYHRGLLRWEKRGTRKNSFLISENYVVFRFNIAAEERGVGETIGGDTGLKTVLTLSNESITPKHDNHGHSLESILDKLSRKRRGSKNFGKAQEHRKNFINWSINRLNFKGIRQLNLEKVGNINFGKRASRKMRAWTNTLIQDKIMRFAEEQKVSVNLQKSVYKSQRCCVCGLVRKSNRKGERYECKNCGNDMNADLNAAKNHAIELPPIPFGFCRSRKNLWNGFFWLGNGIYSSDSQQKELLPVTDIHR